MKFWELKTEITDKDLDKFNYPNRRLGVIIHIEDTNQSILLQQRGSCSRDEKYMYEDVGGSVDETDKNFKTAILREMHEEMGLEVDIQEIEQIGIFHVYKHNINWIFIIFKGKYIGGPIKIMEPNKCEKYKFFDYEEAITSKEVSNSCKCLIKSIKNI